MHSTMLYTVGELEEKSSLANKITAIIATCQAPINTLFWSIGSLLLRSDPAVLEHVIVSINGPDRRTGDPGLQDRKQSLLEELRNLRWHDRDMPLTIQRTWSRIGHTQAMESAIPWVHTEFYLIMHDDVMVVDADWISDFLKFSEDKRSAMLYAPPLLLMGVHKKRYEDGWKLALPHLNSAFLVCRKSIFHDLGLRWWGYHIKDKVKINPEFLAYHAVNGDIALPVDVTDLGNRYTAQARKLHRSSRAELEVDFNYFNLDIGAWVYYRLQEENYAMKPLQPLRVYHFKSGSWNHKTFDTGVAQSGCLIPELEILMREQKQIPGLWELYEKYVK